MGRAWRVRLRMPLTNIESSRVFEVCGRATTQVGGQEGPLVSFLWTSSSPQYNAAGHRVIILPSLSASDTCGFLGSSKRYKAYLYKKAHTKTPSKVMQLVSLIYFKVWSCLVRVPNSVAVEMSVLKFLWALWLACVGGVTPSNPFVIVGHNLGWSLCHLMPQHLYDSIADDLSERGLGHLCVFHEVAEFNPPPAHLLARAVKRGNWNINLPSCLTAWDFHLFYDIGLPGWVRVLKDIHFVGVEEHSRLWRTCTN